MKILDAWFIAVSNHQTPEGKRRPGAFEPRCLVDSLPVMPPDLPYRVPARRDGRRLFFREHEGLIEFFEHNPRNENGYGGAVLSGLLTDGTAFKVKGPWSSSCGTVNALGLPSSPCAGIAAKAVGGPAWGLRHLIVTLPILEQVALAAAPDWKLVVPESRGVVEGRWAAGMSDEQLRAIGDGEPVAIPHFLPSRDLEDCVGCEGTGGVRAGSCGFCSGTGIWPRSSTDQPCYRCQGRGYERSSCPACDRSVCGMGIAPYPRLGEARP